MIIYAPVAVSLLKACILSKTYNTGCLCSAEIDHTPSLFCSDAVLSADDFELNNLIAEYCGKYNQDLAWINNYPGTRLKKRINYALKNSSPRKYLISRQAVAETLEYGPEYCLNNVSASGRQLYKLAAQVYHEVHRMLGFIRFQPLDASTLAAEPKLYHDTAPLVLRRFRPRYPGYRLILLLPDSALGLDSDNSFFSPDPQPLRRLLQDKDGYNLIWQDYYQSQYIQSRKNIPLAQKAIPQKYWDWLEEGKILAEEKKKS